MIRLWLGGVLVCAGCPGQPTPTGPGSGSTVVAARIDAAPAAPVDAPEVSEDEKVAMINRAMVDLTPVANQCWAAGAVDDYQLAGSVTLEIAPHGDGARVAVGKDTTGDTVLTHCLQTVASSYAWPAGLSGEVIELPFAFTAPHGQFVIDRRLVGFTGQAGVGVGVLLDQKNSGNGAASMFELMFKDGAVLALAKTDRHEVWYVTAGDGLVSGAGPGAKSQPIRTGDVIDVAAGAYREIKAGQSELTAMVVLVPGQVEGVGRGGALPGQTVFGAIADKKPLGPRVIPSGKGTTWNADKRIVDIYLDSAKGGPKDVSLEVLTLDAGAVVPEHEHAGETELLYVMSGAGSMVIDGVTLPITDTTVVQIPKATRHQATVTEAMRAIQLYTPAGPEQRFKK